MKYFVYSQADYIDFYKAVSSSVSTDGRETVFHIASSYGSGRVTLFHISEHSNFLMFDICFSETVEIIYELPHDHFEIAYCVRGGCVLMEGKKKKDITPNTMTLSMAAMTKEPVKGIMVIPKGIRYVNLAFAFSKEACHHYFGSVGSNLWNAALSGGGGKEQFFLNQEFLPQVQNAFFQIQSCAIKDINAKCLFIESRISEIISYICAAGLREEQPGVDAFEKEQIKKIPSRMTEDFLNPPTISQLSRELGVNITKLKKGFKQLYGTTIYGYHKRAKLEHARDLLLNTELTILDVAQKSGYISQSQFGAAFKEEFGVTPSDVRKNGF